MATIEIKNGEPNNFTFVFDGPSVGDIPETTFFYGPAGSTIATFGGETDLFKAPNVLLDLMTETTTVNHVGAGTVDARFAISQAEYQALIGDTITFVITLENETAGGQATITVTLEIHGSLIASQVPEIYQAVLQRPPTDAELTSQVALASSNGIAAVVSDVVGSAEAQFNVYPVIQVIALALGHNPTSAQLAGWVPFVESQGLLQGQAQSNVLMDQMATAFVASDNFGTVYNNGVNVDPNSPVTAHEMQVIIQAATGIAATQAQVNAWLGLGLTIDQVFVDFALGDQYTAFSQAGIQQYLTSVADAAAGIQASSIVGSTASTIVAHA